MLLQNWSQKKNRSDAYNIGVAVEEYEMEMFERCRINAEKTRKNLGLHFSEKGGEEMRHD